MSKRFILMSLLIVAGAALLMEFLRHQRSVRSPQVATNASGAGTGVPSQPSHLPLTSATPTVSQNGFNLSSQRPIAAGGQGAGKPRPGSSVKAPRTPGVPREVLEAAETGLPFFLGQIPPGSKGLYGFASTDDLSAARLGGPLQMHTMTPAAIEKSSSSATVSSVLSDTSMWFFPVLIENESRAMLVVDRDGETWKAVSLGYAGLGHELNELLAQWPESKGFRPQLIAVFQARQFYFTVPQVGDFNLTLLRVPTGGLSKSSIPFSPGQTQPPGYATLTPVSTSLELLKPMVLSAQNYPTR
jgi:hypothetical protein